MSALELPSTRITSHGKNRSEFVSDGDALPDASEVVIIGGGANGLFTAWNLARRGVQVTVCEKGEVAGESSSRAFGWISGLLLDPCKMELTRQSLDLWADAQAEIGEIGYRVNGLCYLAGSDQEMAYYEAWRDQTQASSYRDAVLLDPQGVAELFPGATRRWSGAIWARLDGSAEPKLAAAAVARAARQCGARIVQNCAVRGLDVSAGRISGVVTERGRIRTSSVVFAGNLWSRLFCGNHGIDVPQLYAIMSMGCTTVVPDGPRCSGGREDWAWRRQIDGAYSLGRLRGQRVPVTRDAIQLFSRFMSMMRAEAHNVSRSWGKDAWRDLSWPRKWQLDRETVFERNRIYDPWTDPRVSEESLRLNAENFTAFRDARIAETWAGAVTITPDNMPIASPVRQIEGFYRMTGCAYGLTWSPALGRMMADLVMGRTALLDPTPYRLERFSDGTPITVKV